MEKSRFKLKTFVCGFEVPFYDPNDKEGNQELQNEIASTFSGWFDTLKIDIDILELPNTNILLLFSIIIRVDSNCINDDTLIEKWDEMKDHLKTAMTTFLNKRNLDFKIIKQEDDK